MSLGDSPAFPDGDQSLFAARTGMTYRQLVAAMALQGVIGTDSNPGVIPIDRETAARRAVAYADALIAELEKKP